MSEANLATLHEIYDRWARGDFLAGPEHFDPDLVFVMRPEFADSGTYLGPEQVAGYMRVFLDPWERITIEASEIIESGDSFVAAVTQRGVGASSRIETEMSYFHAWTFRGPKIIRFETFREREEALAAVGLS